jgi:hypothetical protein
MRGTALSGIALSSECGASVQSQNLPVADGSLQQLQVPQRGCPGQLGAGVPGPLPTSAARGALLPTCTHRRTRELSCKQTSCKLSCWQALPGRFLGQLQ